MRRSLTIATSILAAALSIPAQSWNLDSVPQYRPGAIVSGTIRTWGEDVAGDLVKLWEEGFRKHHPQVRFEDNMNSSALAMPGLSTGVADLGLMGREVFPLEVL